METILMVVLYLIGVTIPLWIGIKGLKEEGGTVKELLFTIVISLTSWVIVMALLVAYVQEKIEDSNFWNKQIFK